MSPAAVRSPAPRRVVFDGQSQLLTPLDGRMVPEQTMTGTKIPFHNAAIAGVGWEVDTDPAGGPGLDASASTRLFPQIRHDPELEDVLVLLGGQGDALYAISQATPDPGEVAFDALVNYATAARAAGFSEIIACTWPSIGNPTVQAAYTVHNGLLLADNSGTFDAVVDIEVGDLAVPGSDAFLPADVLGHLSEYGASLVAAALRPVVIP